MKLTTKQIKKILDCVPDGATHYVTCTDDYLDYTYNTLCYGGDWYECNMDTIAEPHDISDLREILTLRKRVQELEKQNAKLLPLARRWLCDTYVWDDYNFQLSYDVQFLGRVSDKTNRE